MNFDRIQQLLTQVQRGELSPAEAALQLKHLPFESLGALKIDHHRALRTGQPETIYAPGKTADEIQAALESISAAGSDALVTRLTEETAAVLKQRLPELVYHRRARCAVSYIRADRRPQIEPRGHVSVLCAGVSDLPVAEEARLTAELMGAACELISDVGVAG
ncbi:MAG TPA: 1-(5-phosphoribosyl)-5-amino-4-imidazole-carboxylate carboxylase, partial [candidate division Zixibacteria bacterium]|nr:1-(5-phosphoribosyl)-5-amino-4-imidazole-carboxylate carboxylase [candidate division Zixibacteria bacterium]